MRPGRLLSILLLFAIAAAHDTKAGSPTEACLAAAGHDAVLRCEEAVAADPNDKSSLRALGYAYLSVGEAEPSFKAYARLIELAPGDWSAQYDAAAAFATFGLYSRAVGPALEAVRLNPDELAPNRMALLILQGLGRSPEAFPMLRQAAMLGDDTAMVELAAAFEQGIGIGRDEKQALSWLERAAEADNALAVERLAEVYAEGELGVAPDSARAAAYARRAWEQRHYWDNGE